MSPTEVLRYRMHHTASRLRCGPFRKRPHDDAAELLNEAATILRRLELELDGTVRLVADMRPLLTVESPELHDRLERFDCWMQGGMDQAEGWRLYARRLAARRGSAAGLEG